MSPWGLVFKAVGNGVSTGVNMYNSIEAAKAQAQATAMESAATASEMLMQGAVLNANKQIEALNYDTQAEYYLSQAEGFGLQGRQEREQIGLGLLQSKGDIVSSAAGSGIEVTSRVVEKTMKDTALSAYHDMETSAVNEYGKIYGAMKNNKVARVNAANARSIGAWANEAYASLASQVETNGAALANSQLKAGYNSAISQGIGYAVNLLGIL